MSALLISTYDLGRSPFGLASPAAWLAREGVAVRCLDLGVESLDRDAVRDADLIGFFLPMHTATRLAARVIPEVRALAPRAHLCAYGLYASPNAEYLRSLGVSTVLGGEFERELADLARALRTGAAGAVGDSGISLERLEFLTPDRSGMPAPARYARLRVGAAERITGYTEASRGCRHLCRHCPVPVVYGGRFRVVPHAVVLEDVRRQVAAGARHITFGDPDFLNGPGHAFPLVEALHREHPDLSYDVTIKVEHLLRHRDRLGVLRDTGCAFVTSALESVDDAALARLEKGHTRADIEAVVGRLRAIRLPLQPTFVAFMPWTTLAGYRELLRAIAELDLVDATGPVQLAIRLLLPRGSRLLELTEVRAVAGEFDRAALLHPWRHPDPEVDALQARIEALVRRSGAGAAPGRERRALFARVAALAGAEVGEDSNALAAGRVAPRPPVPFLTEPWYC